MISDLYIPATNKSPEISLSANGKITISGRCFPTEPNEFYTPVMDWASEYCREPAEETVVDLSIEYLNCTNSGKIYWFLQKLKEVILAEKKLVINYLYEADDEDMRDYGATLQESLKHPVNIQPVDKLILPDMTGKPPSQSNNLPSE